MSKKNRHRRDKKPRKRSGRRWPKLTWKDVLLYGPLVLFLLVCGIGPYVYEFCYHRNLEYTLVLIGVIVTMVFVFWAQRKSR